MSADRAWVLIHDGMPGFFMCFVSNLPVLTKTLNKSYACVFFLGVTFNRYIYAALNLRETLCVLCVTNTLSTSRSSCPFLLESLLMHPPYGRLRQLSTVINAKITVWPSHLLRAILSVASTPHSQKMPVGNDGAVSVVNSSARLAFRSGNDDMSARSTLGMTLPKWRKKS